MNVGLSWSCRECLQLLPNKNSRHLWTNWFYIHYFTSLSWSLHRVRITDLHNLQRATYYITICQSKILTILGPSLQQSLQWHFQLDCYMACSVSYLSWHVSFVLLYRLCQVRKPKPNKTCKISTKNKDACFTVKCWNFCLIYTGTENA